MGFFGLPERVLIAIVSELQKRENVTRTVILGSRARRDYKYNSDIDLAVYCEGNLPAGLRSEIYINYFPLFPASGNLNLSAG
ncbi:nucleotidyltransferase family protein [Thermincola ferriacetica]|uniref:nucleotidyltransferase family protein n=1 Tax=Thermincola ferriacetica TaxID=281456 RepID=UPI0009FA34D7|nr:nucleotidyltransferase domain-containing protein [Thermincola ferriacetica]